MVEHPDGEAGEQYILCRSSARAEKERAMLQRQSERLTEALVRIARWLQRQPQADHEAVGRRIGRALGQYPAAAAIIEATVLSDESGRTVGLRIASDVVAGRKAYRQKGA